MLCFLWQVLLGLGCVSRVARTVQPRPTYASIANERYFSGSGPNRHQGAAVRRTPAT
jgi:hypothetical protein